MKRKKQKTRKAIEVPTTPARPVDVAMRADRPAKDAVRSKWIEVLKGLQDQPGPYPSYLTLPGAEGKDIQLLVENGLISLTENGGIATESVNYCVAVENSKIAVFNLQKRYPGLRIIEQDIKSVLRGDSGLVYPDRADRPYCQAHVVNLDLQQTLAGEFVADDVSFPVFRWIEKFGSLHLDCPHRSWHLLLTLNATVEWSSDLCGWVTDFLRDNFEKVAAFREGASRVLAPEVFKAIQDGKKTAFGKLQLPVRQRLLLVIIPKAIGYFLCRQGWRITTKLNAEYIGANGAPMVTFIFNLTKPAGYHRHEKFYIETVSQCLLNVERITPDGQFANITSGGASEA